jgi:FAD/FMN-containing dehydrogenase
MHTERYRFRNWSETLEWRPHRFYRPESEEEVALIVHEASDARSTLRTFDAGHSWSPLVITGDYLIKRTVPSALNVARLQDLTVDAVDHAVGRVQPDYPVPEAQGDEALRLGLAYTPDNSTPVPGPAPGHR